MYILSYLCIIIYNEFIYVLSVQNKLTLLKSDWISKGWRWGYTKCSEPFAGPWSGKPMMQLESLPWIPTLHITKSRWITFNHFDH